jgi:outer membrane protein OmpA-like peptidoglycan-associated protein
VEEQLGRALRESADARAENRSLKSENDRLRDDVERLTRDLAEARNQVASLQSQFSSANSKLVETSSRVEAMERADRDRRDAEAKARAFSDLQSSLARLVTVKPTSNGFAAVLPDSFFVTNQKSLALKVKSKMDALGQTLAAHPDLLFIIEGHSDSRATAEDFAFGRAQSVADYIAAYGVPRANFKVESRGSTAPVSTGRSVAAKAANRRVEIIFVAPH